MNLEERKESLHRLKEKYEKRLFELTDSNGAAHSDLNVWKRRHLYCERIEAVELALHTIELGTYGSCLVCGRPITSARLRMVPFTTRCFECELNKHNRL